MSEHMKFSAGDTAWTDQGESVHVIDETKSGSYLVAPMIEFGGSYDEPPTTDLGALRIVDNLYDKAPMTVIDAAFAAGKARVGEAAAELVRLQADIRVATAERKNLLAKLAQVPALQHIEAAIEGRFTHIVERSAYASRYNIGTVEEILASNDRYSKGLRLLSLYGDAKGDLQWRISHYSDGSGGSSDAWPFPSEEEALAFVRKRIAEDIVYHTCGHSDSRPYYLIDLCKQARSLGVAVPDAAAAVEKAEARKVADHALAEARKGVESAQQRLAVAEAQAQAVLA